MDIKRLTAVFDDGREVDVTPKSRDYAILERSGFDVAAEKPWKVAYVVAFTVLQRLHRNGALDFDLPDDAEALMDLCDIEAVGDPDTVGEDSGQAAVTG